MGSVIPVTATAVRCCDRSLRAHMRIPDVTIRRCSQDAYNTLLGLCLLMTTDFCLDWWQCTDHWPVSCVSTKTITEPPVTTCHLSECADATLTCKILYLTTEPVLAHSMVCPGCRACFQLTATLKARTAARAGHLTQRMFLHTMLSQNQVLCNGF